MQASTTRPRRGCCRLVTARANAGAQGAASASALFDAGYLTETYKQIAMLRGERQFANRARTIAGVIGSADGTAIIDRAITLRPDDASLPFCSRACRRYRRPHRVSRSR